MEIKINWEEITEQEGDFKIKVLCGNYSLDVSKTSEMWNNHGINEFLVNIGAAITGNQKFNVVYQQDIQSPVYKHVCNLFINFADEYNKHVELEMQRNN